MKKSVRILLTVVAFVIIASLSVAVITAEGTTPGTVAEARALLNEVNNPENTKLYQKTEAIYDVTKYLAEHPIDSAAEGYDAFMAEFNAIKYEYAQTLLATCEGYTYEPGENELPGLNAARKMGAVNDLKTFVERNPLDESTAGYAEFMAKVEAEYAEKEKYKAESIIVRDSEVSLDEYEAPTHIKSDYNGSPHNMSLSSAGNTEQYTSKLVVNPATGKRVWSITYNGTNLGYSAYYPKNVSDNVVIQFDIQINENIDNGFQLEQEVVNTRWFRIEPDGSVNTGNYRPNGDINTAPGVKVALGQWVNIALVINLENAPYTYDVYIDYQKVFENCIASPWQERTFNNIRFTGSNTVGQYYLDNIFIYRGTALRTVGRLDKMSSEEKFVYYANYAADETKSFPTRKTAYTRANELYAISGLLDKSSESVIAAKGVLDAVEYDSVVAGACEQNTERFIELVGKVGTIARHPDTEAKRTTAIEKVETFMTNAGNDLLSDSAEYKAAYAELSKYREELAEETRIRLFNAKMIRFAAASTIVAMQTHYDEAKALLEEGISIDISTVEGFEEFAVHYAVYLSASETLHTAILESNSKKIVDCVGFISKYTTEEEWVENYDQMERYILIIRETLASGEYDINYAGLVGAINTFTPMEEFFYARLQDGHIAFITENLRLYEEATDYVNQVGILATIKRYVETADIDHDNEVLAALLVQLDYYDAEVQVRGEDYALVLRENSAKFILLIEQLLLQNDYASTRAIFEEAASYYNSIDRDYEGTAEAIAIYKEYEAEFDTMDIASKAFVESVALIATAKDDEDLFARLADACYFYANINVEIDGVSEALAAYQAAYNAYNETYISANTDIDEAVKCAVSVRANCGVDAIVDVICKKLLG